MKISTKGRYAMESVLDLALYASGHESLRTIAERRGISENYLEQIFILLRKKGIVESVRGAAGGYYLARPASEITAGEILRAVEGPLTPVLCVEGTDTCERADGCVTRLLWSKLKGEIDAASDAVTLQTLVESCRDQHLTAERIEYYI